VNTRLIARGVLAGAVGGLAAFAGARIGAEPIVGHVITVAGVRMQALSAVDEHGAELLSPGVQATGEMAFVVVAFGRCDGRSTGRGIRHHVRPNRLGSAWGACAAAGSRWIRRVVVGAVGKVSARAGSRRHHQPEHRLVPVDGRPVGGVGDRRRHAGRRITRRLGQLVLWATVAVVSRGSRTGCSMPRPIGIYGCKPDGPLRRHARADDRQSSSVVSAARISGSPLGFARVGAHHAVERAVTYG